MMPKIDPQARRLWLAALALAFVAGIFFGYRGGTDEQPAPPHGPNQGGSPIAAYMPALA